MKCVEPGDSLHLSALSSQLSAIGYRLSIVSITKMSRCRWTKWEHFAGLEAEVFCRWRFAGRVCPVAGLPKSGVCTDGGGRTRSKTAPKWVFLGQKWHVFGSNSSAYKWTGAISYQVSAISTQFPVWIHRRSWFPTLPAHKKRGKDGAPSHCS